MKKKVSVKWSLEKELISHLSKKDIGNFWGGGEPMTMSGCSCACTIKNCEQTEFSLNI